ncbi:DUF3592 domain-containing protein [Lysobacter sp. CA199]|uniref:DUF3592 domain-containing protein n=1 Tax=Lysobacter sp. CA199 TaxID=3455608 RepID=UPI003F8D81F0
MKLSLGAGMNWLWLFPAIGVAMLLGAIVIAMVQQRFQSQALRAQGVVMGHALGRGDSDSSRSGDTYCPVVRFVDGDGQQIEFVGGVCSRPRAEAAGETVAVLYRQGDPHDARIDSFLNRWFAVLIVGGIGSVFALIGAFIVVPTLRGRRIAAALQKTGVAVQAEVIEAVRDGSVEVNGRSPWRIHAQWRDPASGKIHLFHSDALWFDPGDYLDERVAVLIQPGKPGRYWMDTRFLPELA